MRVDRPLKFLTVLAAISACSAPAATPDAAPPAAAAAPAPVAAAPAADPAPAPEVSVRWDSHPLDLEYQRERASLDSRFKIEISTPRSGESARDRDNRQAAERKALEDRYERGKKQHARGLPPS
jgi:hypothetical protein